MIFTRTTHPPAYSTPPAINGLGIYGGVLHRHLEKN